MKIHFSTYSYPVTLPMLPFVNSNKNSLIDQRPRYYYYFFLKSYINWCFLPQLMYLGNQRVKGSYVCLSTPKQKAGLILIQRSVPPHVSSHHTRSREDQKRARQMECGILGLAVAHHHATLGTVGGLHGVRAGFQSSSMIMKSTNKARGHPGPVLVLFGSKLEWSKMYVKLRDYKVLPYRTIR